jgi:hypothetical protein
MDRAVRCCHPGGERDLLSRYHGWLACAADEGHGSGGQEGPLPLPNVFFSLDMHHDLRQQTNLPGIQGRGQSSVSVPKKRQEGFHRSNSNRPRRGLLTTCLQYIHTCRQYLPRYISLVARLICLWHHYIASATEGGFLHDLARNLVSAHLYCLFCPATSVLERARRERTRQRDSEIDKEGERELGGRVCVKEGKGEK